MCNIFHQFRPGGISLVRFDDRYVDVVLNDDLQLVEVQNEQ